MFPGQGSQRPGMATALYQAEPVFRGLVDQCTDIAGTELGTHLRELLLAPEPGASGLAERMRDTAIAQPALFAVEYALARTWISWGVTPEAMIGHSVGEYVAACLAGVLPLADAMRLVAARGRLMASMPAGSMLSVAAPADKLAGLLSGQLGLAAVNSQELSVLSGPDAEIDRCEAELGACGVATRRLRTSHAFHSPMMTPVVAQLRALIDQIPLRIPAMPFVSSVTGTWITEAQATDAGYWAGQLCATVRFAAGMDAILAEPDRVLLEVGPGETLGKLARQHPASQAAAIVASMPASGDGEIGRDQTQHAIARLWLAGAEVDWDAYHAGESRRRVPMPTYPFQRRRFWVGGGNGSQLSLAGTGTGDGAWTGDGAGAGTLEVPPATSHERPAHLTTPRVEPRSEIEGTIAGVWQDMLGIAGIGVLDRFIDLGGHSLLATQIATRLREIFSVDLTIERFFALETIAEVAVEIEDLLIAEIDELSDEEVLRLSEISAE